MHYQSMLNATGLGITTIAAVLMFFYPPVVTVFTDKGERVISWVGATTDEDRKVATRRQRLSRLAVALLVVGFLFQLVAALPPRHDEPTAQDDVTATEAPPVECAGAKSAEECADISAKLGKNPFDAYGVVGREPAYRPRASALDTAHQTEPAGDTSPVAGPHPEAPAILAVPVPVPVPSRPFGYVVGYRPFEQFGLDVVYGLVTTLREDTATTWKLFEYRIGLYDELVRATYAADSIARPVEFNDLARSTILICRAAANQPQLPPEPWIVELDFVRWDDQRPVSGPFTIQRSDCR